MDCLFVWFSIIFHVLFRAIFGGGPCTLLTIGQGSISNCMRIFYTWASVTSWTKGNWPGIRYEQWGVG